MPHGSIAGFDRPLAESELRFETLLRVDNEYGVDLERNSFRSEQEERMEEIVSNNVGRRVSKNMTLQLSPAGNSVGVAIALGTDEIVSGRSRNQGSLEGLVAGIEAIKREMDEVNSFGVPGAFSGFGERTDEVLYSIKAE